MGHLDVTIADMHFSGRWVDGAPRTIEAIRGLLPLRSQLIHCRWSGEGCWIPFGEAFLPVGPENATSHPAPGQLILYPGGPSECEILLAYGAVDFSSKVGQLAGNHFATLTTGLDRLPELGRRVLWEGAQAIAIDEIPHGAVIEAAPAFDLLVRGGRVVRSTGSARLDVAARNGTIVAVEADIPAASASRVIDADGLLVLPGVIDVHTHARIASDAEPDRFYQDSIAAAHGGTTTFLAFNNPGTGISAAAQTRLSAGISEWLARTEGDSAVDVGLSAVITAQQERPEADIAAAVAQGVASFKCFLVYDFGVSAAQLRVLLAASGRAGALLQVHGEDAAMLEAGIAAQLDLGERGPLGHARSRPSVVEAVGTARAVQLAAEAGTPVYMVHVSSRAAQDVIAAARRTGQRVYAETCPHYLALDESRYALPPQASIGAVISPPLRSLDDQAALWSALDGGTLDLVATDHVPDRLALEKRWQGQPFPGISNGAPGIETLLRVTFSEGVARGRMSIERLVDVLATTPARLFGLPAKGAVEVGRDADLVLFDPQAHGVLRQADLHHTSDYTPYEGMAVQGAIRRVVLRGQDVVAAGVFVGGRGRGHFVERHGPPA